MTRPGPHCGAQGSLDGKDWVTLMVHKDDAALDAKGAAHTWAIPSKFHDTPYRLFRVIMTGVRSVAHHTAAAADCFFAG